MPLLVTPANTVPKLITKTPIMPLVTLPQLTILLVMLLRVIPPPINRVMPKTTEPAKPMLTANTETVLINTL